MRSTFLPPTLSTPRGVFEYKLKKNCLGEALSVPSLLDMKLVKGAMDETLRLMPVIQGLGRVTQKDLVLSGYKVIY